MALSNMLKLVDDQKVYFSACLMYTENHSFE